MDSSLTTGFCVPQAVGLGFGKAGQEVLDLQNYLRRFGYLRQYDSSLLSIYPLNSSCIPDATPGMFDKGTLLALQTYQKFFCLEPTGVLDDLTIAQMSLPRCGVPDMPYQLSIGPAYTHLGFKWAKNNLRWKTGLQFPDFLPPGLTWEQFENFLNNGLEQWSAVTPLSFTRVNDDEGTEVLCRFTTMQEGDNPNDGPGGVFAATYSASTADGVAIAPAQIRFDKFDVWSFGTPSPNTVDLLSVVIHEMGHFLGLGHTDINTAIMFPTLSFGQQKRTLGQDDINGIQALYGS